MPDFVRPRRNDVRVIVNLYRRVARTPRSWIQGLVPYNIFWYNIFRLAVLVFHNVTAGSDPGAFPRQGFVISKRLAVVKCNLYVLLYSKSECVISIAPDLFDDYGSYDAEVDEEKRNR